MKISQSYKKNLLLLILCFLQMIVFVWAIRHKITFFGDELWSFNLANSEVPFLDASQFFHKWLSGEDFRELLVATRNHCFDYGSVWDNQVADVHPPLYYAVLHTLCSIFPNTYDKWIGTAPNFLFFLITQICLYKIAKFVYPYERKASFAFLVCAFYGFCLGAINTVIMVRMYSMLVMFTTLAAWINLKIIDKVLAGREIRKELILIFFVYLGGALTQYTFVIPVFFISAITALTVLTTDKKKFVEYALTAICGILTLFVVFPSAYQHIFLGYRGNEARGQLSQFFYGLGNRIHEFGSLLNFETYLYPFLFISLLLVAYVILKNFIDVKKEQNNLYISFRNKEFKIRDFLVLDGGDIGRNAIFTATIGGFVILSKMTVVIDSRYLMIIHPMVVLSVLLMFFQLGKKAKISSALMCSVAIAVFALHTAKTIHTYNLKWNMNDLKPAIQVLEGKTSLPRPEALLYINKDTCAWPTVGGLSLFSMIEKVYLAEPDDLDSIKISSDKSVMLVMPQLRDQEALKGLLQEKYHFEHFEKIAESDIGGVYLMYNSEVPRPKKA